MHVFFHAIFIYITDNTLYISVYTLYSYYFFAYVYYFSLKREKLSNLVVQLYNDNKGHSILLYSTIDNHLLNHVIVEDNTLNK